MAVTITIDEVKSFQDSSLSDDAIQCMIDAMNEADSCLDANGVPNATQKLLKTYGVAHQLLLADGGRVSRRTAQEGASIQWSVKESSGLASTQWGVLLKNLDRYGCVTALLDNGDGYMFMTAIGPGGNREQR